MPKDWEQAAGIVWPVLVQAAQARETVFYSELALRIPTNPLSVRNALEPILSHCQRCDLPPLTVVAINKTTGKPGAGFRGIDDIERAYEAVYQYPWDTIENPFASSRERSQTGRETGSARQDPEQQTPLPAAADEKPFEPKNEKDARERIEQTIVQRRGQRRFRDSLISAYEGKCAITGCSILDVLEAAHIVPYRGEHTDKTPNGLLLRADLHTLFDCRLVAIDPATMEVLLAPRIADSEYKKWCGRRIRIPKNPEAQPNTEALRTHLEDCKNAWGE